MVGWWSNAGVTGSWRRGCNFKNERGEWEESEEKIEILPNDPGALAAKGQHKAIFPPELQSGLIELQTPDGVWLRSRIWGLAYFDAASGESVLLAEAKESEGQLADDNVVMYPDAFTEVRADVRYIYTRAGFEQDVVLRVKPPAPEAFGLDPDTTRLQVLTEFMTARTPNATRRQTEGLPDDTLDFGAANIGIGKAFSVDANDQNSPEIPVAKQWKRIDERDFLIEEVWYEQVSEQLNKLPSAGRNEGASLLRRRGKGESVLAGLQPHLPKRFTETASPPAKPPRRMAKADYDPSLGFVMDYVMVNSSLTNYVFKGDTTYHVTGTVLLYGTNVIEGNTVIKYNASTYLRVMGQMQWETEAYRPAVLTAKDDNSVGETVSGSSGNPNGYYATFGIYFSVPTTPVDMKYTYVRHANYGLALVSGGAQTHCVRNCQFLNVNYGTYITSTTAELENLLYHRVGGQAIYGSGSTIRASHLTVHQAGNALNTASSAGITNSLFIWVTNWPTAFTSVSNGTNNNSSTFQTVGGGEHYLASSSPYRNAGSTNLSASLLAHLKRTTTCPPIAYTNVTFTAPATFHPQAQRDTDTPDLGYHYDPLDHNFGGCAASSSINFSAGTVAGWFRSSSGWYHAGQAIRMQGNITVSFDGLATAPAYFVRLNTVQENDKTGGYGHAGIANWEGPATPTVRGRFLRCSAMANEVHNSYFGDDYGNIRAEMTHSEFWSGNLRTHGNNMTYTNCLIWRSGGIGVINGASGGSFAMRNCTMIGGLLLFQRTTYYGPTPVSVRDSAFDGTLFTLVDSYSGDPMYTDYDYNAYTNASNPFPLGGANDVAVTSGFNWQSSWLGNHYLRYDSPLIDVGSVTADSVGLYHFTTQTDAGTKEYGYQVDIGYHYAGVDGGGFPLDSDSDGVPDYQEDFNGNGTVESGETDWMSGSDAGLRVRISRPRSDTFIP